MKFKVGDKVYCKYQRGIKKGKVINILKYETLSLIVLFEDGSKDSFTPCGRWLSKSTDPILFKPPIKEKIDKLLEI